VGIDIGANGSGGPTPDFQCVEFAERYLDVKHGYAPINGTNGDQVVAHYASAHSLTVVKNGIGQLPQVGAVMSFADNSSFNSPDGGHVAVVTAVTSSSVTIVGENQDGSGPYTDGSATMTVTGNDDITSFDRLLPSIEWFNPTSASAPSITSPAATSFTAAPADTTSVVGVAANAKTVYELHSDSTIWRYTGTPCTTGSPPSCEGWVELDDNPAAVAIAASASTVYELHSDGSLWQSTGVACSGTPLSCPGWRLIDDNPAITSIAAGGNHLYELHSDGGIWRYTGTPCTTGSPPSCPGWTQLDDNPTAVAIAASTKTVYELHSDGTLWRSTGTPCSGTPLSCPGWRLIDDNPAITSIAAGGNHLYELHSDGGIWRYTGTPCTTGSPPSCPGWTQLDDSPAAVAIAASTKTVYELHSDGTLWRSTGAACSGTPLSCPGWTLIDDNPAIAAIYAGGPAVYEVHSDSSLWQYTGTPCTGSPPSCPGWSLLNASPAVTPGSFTIQATGSPAPSFTETGALPTGVTLSPTGLLSGTPQPGTGGTYPITITAANGVAPNATQNFALKVTKTKTKT
jgi:hypothetical protein